MAFPTSYLVEKRFSGVINLLSKQRNRLKLCEGGNLRLRLSDFKPNIKKLVQLRQPQGSH